MKKFSIYSLLMGVALLMTACSNRNQTSMMKSVTGKAGELVVVVDPKVWDAEPGSNIRQALAQPQLGLPQDEPIFNLIHIPHQAFGDIFKTTRNLIIVHVGASQTETGVKFKRNVYAYPQSVLEINANSREQFVQLFSEKKDKIVGFFIDAERDRLKLNYSRYHEVEVSKATKKRFGIDLNVPPGFKVAENKEDFMWLRYETPEISQGIFVYSYPYDDDSTFTADYMIGKRNVFLKHNVPGALEGSYMTTERAVPVTYQLFKRDGNYTAEMRGLWKVENDFMGGPFVSLSILDLLNNRIVTLDAFVYSPRKNKRDFIRQVESMIYSSTFTNQKDMDKINSQFEL